MEDLFVSSVCRSADPVSFDRAGEVFDVVQHDIGRFAFIEVILTSSNGCYMG